MNIAIWDEAWNKQPSLDWTDERIAALRAHAADGLSASQIGEILGVTRNAVVGKCHRIGVKLGRNPPGPKPKPDPSASHGKPPTALKRQARNATPAGAPKKSVGGLGVTHAPETQGTQPAIAEGLRKPTHVPVSLNQTLVTPPKVKKTNLAVSFSNKRRIEEAQQKRFAAEAAAAQSPVVIARLACFDAKPDGVTLAKLQPHHCRWPHGEGKRLRFCGEQQEGLGPYCAPHAQLAYVAPVQRPKRAQERPRPNFSFGV